jgi:type II secretory pathway component PulF
VTTKTKVVLFEACFFIGFPVVGMGLHAAFGLGGLFVYMLLLALWCWELFAFCHYRHCRQEEFRNILQVAADTQMPLVSVLKAHLQDRPRKGIYPLWVASLLMFVFPGYYWYHRRHCFDARIACLVEMLEDGIPLDTALASSPGVVSRETAIAVTVGEYTGRLADALRGRDSEQSGPMWLNLLPRLAYPLLLLCVLAANVIFLCQFIMPKYEKIFADFKMPLPASTVGLIDTGRWLVLLSWDIPLVWLGLVALCNLVYFQERAAWYFPVVGKLVRLHARGQFLRILGLMLEDGKPLPHVLQRVTRSGLLPPVLENRVQHLETQLRQGHGLSESLVANGLLAKSMSDLLVSAEKVRNLPWALQELGDVLLRRSARWTYRLSMVVFPLSVAGCACLIGLAAAATFYPLAAIMEKLHG